MIMTENSQSPGAGLGLYTFDTGTSSSSGTIVTIILERETPRLNELEADPIHLSLLDLQAGATTTAPIHLFTSNTKAHLQQRH